MIVAVRMSDSISDWRGVAGGQHGPITDGFTKSDVGDIRSIKGVYVGGLSAGGPLQLSWDPSIMICMRRLESIPASPTGVGDARKGITTGAPRRDDAEAITLGSAAARQAAEVSEK